MKKILFFALVISFSLPHVPTLADDLDHAAESEAASTSTTQKPWLRRRFLQFCGVSLALGGGGLGIEALVTERNFRQTDNFEGTPRNKRFDIYVVGDSLSASDVGAKGGFLGSLETIWRNRNDRTGSWVIDHPGQHQPGREPQVTTIYDRFHFHQNPQLSKTPLRVTNAARSGAYVDGEALEISRFVANKSRAIYNLSHQVKPLIDGTYAQGELPNMIVLWMGHNNMDWAWDQEEMLNSQDPDAYVKLMVPRITASYKQKLLDLIGRASTENSPTSIVVYGLANMDDAFQAREKAAEMRQEDPSLFPYFDLVPEGFPSMLPKHREATSTLQRKMNAALRKMVHEINQEVVYGRLGRKVQLRYSEAIKGLNDPQYLHELDGFHLSRQGHSLVSLQISGDLERNSIPFLLGR